MRELGITTWLRYVDDVFASLTDKGKAEEILLFLNQQHPNIKFTVELEHEGRLPFLDTSVYRGLTTFHTTIYRKKTFTGVYLNWTSLTSKKYKIGLIYCLLDRIWKICSETSAREEEIKKVKEILARNDYPAYVVDREVDKFMENRNRVANEKTVGGEEQQSRSKDSSRTHTRFIVLPYVSHKAEGFAKRMKGLVNQHYPQVDFNVAFKTPCEVGKHFPYKDNIKKIESRSLVVYKISCATEGCDATYVGKTERILCHRINEHRSLATSACHQHETDTGHKMDFDNTEIIDSADTNFKLECKELLHIVHLKPSLNRQLAAQSKFNIKTLIIAAYPQYANEASTPYTSIPQPH